MAIFTPDGSCELYHNNSKKLETSSTGATLTGKLNLTDIPDATGSTNLVLKLKEEVGER